jgi:hypothetical protein
MNPLTRARTSRRPSEAESSWERPYPRANDLREGFNRSRRRINRINLICGVGIVLLFGAAIWELIRW